MDAAIEVGEAAIDRNPDDLSARFFVGGAYGYKARYLALQEKWWPAYRTGRRGVKQLEEVVKRDPDFADAYLGLGIYHYYSDVLPGVLQFLGTFVGVNGDRERGLRETISINLLAGIEETNEPVPYATLCLVANGLDRNPVELLLELGSERRAGDHRQPELEAFAGLRGVTAAQQRARILEVLFRQRVIDDLEQRGRFGLEL